MVTAKQKGGGTLPLPNFFHSFHNPQIKTKATSKVDNNTITTAKSDQLNLNEGQSSAHLEQGGPFPRTVDSVWYPYLPTL